MQLTDKSYVQSVMRAMGAAGAKKSLGQNFLVDAGALTSIVKAANLSSTDTVVEVGPGLGTLTSELVKAAERVIAIEKDDRFAAQLRPALAAPANLELIHEDILQVNLHELVEAGKYKVVANIPYYLSAPLIRYFLEQAPRPSLIVLLVQKEVAERLTAEPGQLSLLGVSAQLYAEIEVVDDVSAKSFWPVPRVDSAIIRFTLRKTPLYPDTKAFFHIVRMGFAARRKTLLNNLQTGLGLEKAEAGALLQSAGIQSTQRAQELSLEDWIHLVDAYKATA